MIRWLAIVSAALAFSGVAGASTGTERVRDRFGGSYAFAIPCTPFGYAFDVLIDGDDRWSITDIFDADGTLVRTEFHISFTETNTNSVTGKTLSIKVQAYDVWDYVTNTRTVSNATIAMTTDGKAFQDTGRVVMTLDTREPSFVAGPKDVFFGGGLDRVVCEALAP
jgi:hypothetical protein